MIDDYDGNFLKWVPNRTSIFLVKEHTEIFYHLYGLFENIEEYFYNHPDEEDELSKKWERFKDALRVLVDRADEASYCGRDDPPQKQPLTGPPYNIEYLLGYYAREAEFLSSDIDDELDWFEDLREDCELYNECKEAHLHYRRALKYMSNLSV